MAIDSRVCRCVVRKTSDSGLELRKSSTRRRISRHKDRSGLSSASWLAFEVIIVEGVEEENKESGEGRLRGAAAVMLRNCVADRDMVRIRKKGYEMEKCSMNLLDCAIL